MTRKRIHLLIVVVLSLSLACGAPILVTPTTPKPLTQISIGTPTETVGRETTNIRHVCRVDAGLNLRTAAGTSNEVIVVLPDGAAVTLLPTPAAYPVATAWYQVSAVVDGAVLTGWVNSGYLCK